MVRALISFVFQLVSNAFGLIVAAWVLDDVTISGTAFLIAVVIFTVVYAIAQPVLTQWSINLPALRGGVALLATLVGLVVTHLLSDGLSITGTWAWIAATVIVWLVSLLGVLVLPLLFFKKKVAQQRR
jgi:putative membrane protein